MNAVEGPNTGAAPLKVLEWEPKRSAPVVLMPRRLSVEQTRRTKERVSERCACQCKPMKIYVEIHLQGKSDTVLTALEGIKQLMHSLSPMITCVKKVDVKHTSAPVEVVPR